MNSELVMAAPAAAEGDPILLRSHGGDGTAEIEALIGDKIFDLLLYWRLTRRYAIKSEGQLTQLRSVYVSNQTMASIGEKFVVPRHMNRFAWESASVHEKGTAVEAIVGRSFIEHNCGNADLSAPSLPLRTVGIAYEILDAIEACVKTTASHILAGLPVNSTADSEEHTLGHKNPAQALFEWLQHKLKITHPANTITFYSTSGIESGMKTETKFVAEFKLPANIKLSDVAIKTDVKILSEPYTSKKLARDHVARLALLHLKIDSTLSFGAAMRKTPPSQLPPPSYLMPKLAKELPPAYEKPASSRLYEWLQRNGVSFPAKTIEVVNVLGEDDVTRDAAFQGVFTMPNTEPPEIMLGAKFANKREAKEDVAAAALARYAVNSSGPPPADDVVSVASNQNDNSCKYRRLSSDSVTVDASSSGTVVIATSSRIFQSDVVISQTDIVSVKSSKRPPGDNSDVMSRQAVSTDFAEMWNSIQIGYAKTASSDRRESILVCADPISAEKSLEYVNDYLGRYCRDAHVTCDDLLRLFGPEMAPDGDVSLPSVAGLLQFEPHTPWDSTPLREWFEMSWAKKPINALWLLRARIGAQFMFKFWRCRLNGGVKTAQEALVLAAFWDGNFGPFYGIGVGPNPGPAAKSALAQLWPMVKPHVDRLISVAEARYVENEQRALEATQLAVAAAQSS